MRQLKDLSDGSLSDIFNLTSRDITGGSNNVGYEGYGLLGCEAV